MDGLAGGFQEPADGGGRAVAFRQMFIVVAGHLPLDGIGLDGAVLAAQRLDVLNAQDVVGLLQDL